MLETARAPNALFISVLFATVLGHIACSSSGGGGGAACPDGSICTASGGSGGSSVGGGSGTLGQGGTSGSGGSGASGGSTGSGGAPPAPDAPNILTLSTNLGSITEGESVLFTAIVTDPQGIEDVIGGTLRTTEGATYGAFATSAQEGAYSLNVTWDQMQQIASIDFPKPSSSPRKFVAEFFDQAGHTSAKEIEVQLTCNGDAACGGECTDTDTSSQNCGACANQIPDFLTCQNGVAACADPSEVQCGNQCVNLLSNWDNCAQCGNKCPVNEGCYAGKCGALVTADFGTCQAACAAYGLQCGSMDWSKIPQAVPGCGIGTGCAFDSFGCWTQALSCSTTPSPDDCILSFEQFCFCD
jgi:hypothetical protein